LETLPHSATVENFITQVGTGGSHVSVVAETARANVVDGIPSAAVKCFASLGASGKFNANQERDLHTWLKGLYGLELEPYHVQMDILVCWFKLVIAKSNQETTITTYLSFVCICLLWLCVFGFG
jgi:hypothetical protein